MTHARLVVLRALGIGDLLTAVPALRALARAFPAHERILAGPSAHGPLLAHLGVVDRVVDTTGLQPLDGELQAADVAVNLHGRGPRSTALLAATSPTRLLAYDVAGGPEWRPDEHERHRWCRLLTEQGIPADADDYLIPPPKHEIAALGEGATIVHPGAASASRRWPVQRWSAVAAAEHADGRRVLITGSADERSLALDVARDAGLGPESVVAGRTSLVELVALVGAAARVVCGDTGLAHVATATGVPSVVLFGPTPPALWGPPPTGPHIVLWHGGRGDPHGTSTDPALAAITVDEVLSALARLARPAITASGR